MHLLGRTSIDGAANATVELEFLRALCSWISDLSTRISVPAAANESDHILTKVDFELPTTPAAANGSDNILTKADLELPTTPAAANNSDNFLTKDNCLLFFCTSSTLGQFLDAGAGVWSFWCHCSWCLRLANGRVCRSFGGWRATRRQARSHSLLRPRMTSLVETLTLTPYVCVFLTPSI